VVKLILLLNQAGVKNKPLTTVWYMLKGFIQDKEIPGGIYSTLHSPATTVVL